MPFLSFPWQVDRQWYLPINFSFAVRAPNIIGDEPFTVHLPAWIPAINRSSGYMAMCVCVCVKNQIKAFADITKWRPFVHTQSTDKVLLPVFFLHASLPYVWVCLFLLVHHVVFFFSFLPAWLYTRVKHLALVVQTDKQRKPSMIVEVCRFFGSLMAIFETLPIRAARTAM